MPFGVGIDPIKAQTLMGSKLKQHSDTEMGLGLQSTLKARAEFTGCGFLDFPNEDFQQA